MTSNRWINFALAAAVTVLASCATPYQPPGLMGGVDDVQLGPDLYRVTARGNGYTSKQRVEDYVLLRASEIALRLGYPGFVVASSEDQTTVTQATSPGYVSTVVTPNSAFAAVVPPSTTTFIKPGVAVFVRLTRDRGLDARIVNANLAARYGVPPTSAAAVIPTQTSSSRWKEAVAFCRELAKDPRLDPLRGAIAIDGPTTLEMQANPARVTEDQKKALNAFDPLDAKCREKMMSVHPIMVEAFSQVGTGEDDLLKLYERKITLGEYNTAHKQRAERFKAIVLTKVAEQPPSPPSGLGSAPNDLRQQPEPPPSGAPNATSSLPVPVPAQTSPIDYCDQRVKPQCR